ncbi:MAG: hypothetical protein RBR96_01480 [Candidatus Izemoplasmatales bacterium]|jgi:hypothetical protein|nr:hypothetical protein [Candidatus Izemoplasmatales bacterium]
MGKNDLREERMKILELLSKNVINAEQAEKLLAAISKGEEAEVVETNLVSKKNQFRMLRILVDSADGDEVKIEIPIEFAKLLKNKKMMKIDTEDFDIDVDELINMINSGVVGEIVNVKSADGDIVKIIVE